MDHKDTCPLTSSPLEVSSARRQSSGLVTIILLLLFIVIYKEVDLESL